MLKKRGQKARKDRGGDTSGGNFSLLSTAPYGPLHLKKKGGCCFERRLWGFRRKEKGRKDNLAKREGKS